MPRQKKKSSTSAEALHRVRIVQYNILSQALARASWFERNAEEDLDPERRFEKLFAVIEKELAKNDAPIFALQEVTKKFISQVLSYFSAFGYQ